MKGIVLASLGFNRLDPGPGRLYLKLLHSPHWPQHSIGFSYVYAGLDIKQFGPLAQGASRFGQLIR